MAAMPPLRVDPLLSYARRVGDDLQVVLVVGPDAEPVGPDVVLRLRDADVVVDQPVTVTPLDEGQARVESTIPAGALTEGTWKLKLVGAPGTERRNLQTRVLLRSGMPVALLPGRPPDTLLPEPAPR